MPTQFSRRTIKIRRAAQQFTADINILLTKKDFRWLNVLFFYEDGDIDQLILAGK